MPDNPVFDTFTPELLNTLLLAWRKAEFAGREEWLTGELDRRGLGQYRQRLGEVFTTVLGAGYVFLDGYPVGPRIRKSCGPSITRKSAAGARGSTRTIATGPATSRDITRGMMGW